MALTQKEIIEFEESNRDVIRLYLEGTFLKAYERSAFAFCTRVKDFKVLRKESKTPIARMACYGREGYKLRHSPARMFRVFQNKCVHFSVRSS